MAPKTKPYEQFGAYLLFKKLETDALGELWRAGRLDGHALGPLVALRRLSGGNREALVASVAVAKQVAPLLTGASFVREQTIDVANGIPFVAWDYAGGRSLRHIVERARGGTGTTPNPIPLDQAIIIADHVALSLATTADLRYGGDRLGHGALIPHFVWITDDGEIRVAGQQLGKGLIASLGEEKVAAEIGRYMSTEYQHSAAPTSASEVFALGAIFYLTLTGHEPPDATRASAFVQAIRGAKLMTGDPVPDDVRQILEKSLNLDPAGRYASVADMKQALSAAASKYGATSFNLAFYLSNLLKKEMESEALDREREAKTNVLPYFEVSAPPAPLPSVAPAKTRSRAPLAIATGAVIVALAVGGWLALGSKKAVTAAPAPTLASVAPPVAPKPAIVLEPIVASSVTETAPVTTTQAPIDEAARKKAFEDAVRQKLNEEMMKLQAAYTRQLQQQQARNAPVAAAPPPAPAPVTTTVAEERGPSAAQLDQLRRETQRATVEEPAIPTQTVAAVTTQVPAPAPEPAPAAVAAPVATVREGDVVDFTNLDTAPHRTRDPRVAYPPMAARQRIETNVMTSVLVGETGEVLDVKILRGDSRFGFNEAAIRALRNARYTSPMKDGKRVKTWLPQMVQFKP